MPSSHASQNRFLTAPVGRLFLANALPMMVVMSMNGLLTVVDAAFLGHVVGAGALAAVSVVFPLVMVTIALSSLVGGGMSSLLARHLGAGDPNRGAAVLAQAHGLALVLSLLLIVAYGIGGAALIGLMTQDQPAIARMAHIYMGILVLATPVQFLLGVHADAWRNEGRAGLMALLSVGVAMANIALDYLLIVVLDMGVAGSAWGTVLAQALGLSLLVGLRLRGSGVASLSAVRRARWTGGWRPILALGAPVSLSFAGIALVSATVIGMLRAQAGAGYVDSVAAYGIVTRIMGLAFLPMMAIALATQSIAGNNVGAGLFGRSNAALRLALVAAGLYCAAVEVAVLAGRYRIGQIFVTEPEVIARTGAIIGPLVWLYVLAGPVLVLALYFQAIGRPARTAALTLVKPFLLAPALIVLLGQAWGADALWYAFPVADAIVAVIAAALVISGLRSRATSGGFGLARQEQVA